MDDVRVYLAGRLRLEVGEAAVDEATLGGGRQARLAAAFLLAERRRAVPRAELAEALWPGEELPPTWEPALRGVVAKVRAFLAAAGLPAGEALRTAHGAYRVDLPAGATVDLEVAAAALDTAERLLAEGNTDGAVGAALAARAVAARPFLAGEAGLWVEAKQAELRGWHQRALLVLARARLARGEAELAARDAEEAVAAEPLLETAHQLLVQALAAAGNRGAALRAYERCRRTLVDELGVGPSPETEWLYLALLRDEPAAPPAPAAVAGASGPAAPDNGGVLGEPAPGAGGGAFVGRAPELARIAAAWRRARAGRGRQVVLVGGEAGVGKTRLVAEAARAAAHDGAVVLHGRCDEGAAVPYQPFAEALERHAAACAGGELRRHVGGGGGELARLVVGLAQRLPDLAPPAPAAEAGAERSRLFRAVASYVSSVAAESPVVVVLDDLHWAGAPTLLLLRHLLRALEAAPVLVLGTHRDDEAAAGGGGGAGEDPAAALADALAALRREPGVERLALSGLGEADVAALVREADGAGRPDEEAAVLARRLHAETGGNPFYVGELLRHRAEAGGGGGDLGVPEGVREVIGQRLARLSDPARRALQVAAVAGRDFDAAVVEAAGGFAGDDALDALEEATAARFVAEVPDAPAGRYRFAHALVRTAVYEGTGAMRRSRLHRRVADAAEDLAGDDLGPVAAELASHHRAAGPAGDRAKAAGFATRAGDLALAQLAYEEAAAHYESALADVAPGADDTRRCSILVALGAARRAAEAPEAARAAYLEAAELARHRGDAKTLARAALGLFGRATHGVSTWVGGDERVELLEEALAALGQEGDGELRVRVMSALSIAYYLSEADRPRRDALAVEAVASARRLGRPAVLAATLWAGRVGLWGPRNTEARLAHTDQVVAAAAAARDADQELRARLDRVTDHYELGDRRAVGAELEAARSLSARLAQPYWSWRVAAWDALGTLVDGRFDAAEAGAAAALVARADDTDDHALQCYGLQLTCLRLAQGRGGEMAGLLASAVERYPMLPSYRAALAFSLAQAGQEAGARAQFERFAEGGFRSPPPDSNWAAGMAALAEVCSFLGDAERAEALHAELAPLADKMVVNDAFGGGGAFWGSFARLAGLLEATMGRYDEAEGHLRAALEAEARFGAAPWVARTQRALAGVLGRRGRPGDAGRALALAAEAAAAEERMGVARRRPATASERRRPGA